MKVSIITLHAMHNPGSVFQAYALQKYLEEQGNEVEIIDYRPEYIYTEGHGMKFWTKRMLYYKWYENLKKSLFSSSFGNLEISSKALSIVALVTTIT